MLFCVKVDQIYHYTHCITLKRVNEFMVSISALLRLPVTLVLSKKCGSGHESLVTLCLGIEPQTSRFRGEQVTVRISLYLDGITADYAT